MGKSTRYARQKERAVGQSHIPNSWKKSGDQKVTFCQAESAKNDTSDAAAWGAAAGADARQRGEQEPSTKDIVIIDFWSPF